MSGVWFPDCSKLAINQNNNNDVINCWNYVIVIFKCCCVSLVKFSYWSKFYVNKITGSGVMTFSFIRDWPEILKLVMPPSEFFTISGDLGELWVPNLTRMSLMKKYWMLQNSGGRGEGTNQYFHANPIYIISSFHQQFFREVYVVLKKKYLLTAFKSCSTCFCMN